MINRQKWCFFCDLFIAKIAKFGNSSGKTKYIIINGTTDNLGFSEDVRNAYNFRIEPSHKFNFRY